MHWKYMKLSPLFKAPAGGKKEELLPSNACSKNFAEKDLHHQHRKPVPLHIFPGMKLPVGSP